jgi:hypothetical protein
MSKPKEERKTLYGLFILKRDGDHISVLETDNYDEVFESWKQLKDQWTSCVQDSKPFELLKPIVTAFDPNLIYEITVKPVVETTASSKNYNPYREQMNKEGFSNTFGNHAVLSNVKDGGYL